MTIYQRLKYVLLFVLIIPLVQRSELYPGNFNENVRASTRQIEFDYIQWTVNAIYVKSSQSSYGVYHYLSDEQQHTLVMNYIQILNQINETNTRIESIYSDPLRIEPEPDAQNDEQLLAQLEINRSVIEPVVESILQQQISSVLDELDITVAGQPIPPVLFHISSLPKALIISPRDEIKQELDISLLSDISLPDIIKLEDQIQNKLNVSALVVNIGGVGTYPTMVINSTDLAWLIEVIAHEWTHNYLTLHPLGLNYYTSPELRTMNETTANISGKEISQGVLKRYYPELLQPEEKIIDDTGENATSEQPESEIPEQFDFRAEMHQTRITVDHLLEQEKIEEAESYMEARRQIFWENGYQIRKLNQAYFAFHGAYADEPGGASGADPVGPNVRMIRQQSESLADFLRKMSWISSYEDLKNALEP